MFIDNNIKQQRENRIALIISLIVMTILVIALLLL
jgi:hypothetical protein